MDWLASPLWNLFYFAATCVMFAYAYYSRHEYVQKLALLVGASFVAFHIFNETTHELTANYLIDFAGFSYASWLLIVRSHWREITAAIIVIISCIDIGLHQAWSAGGLAHAIAYNLLFLAQLIALSIYGNRYGIIARGESHESRSDLYYRAFTACRLMLRA